MHQVENALLDLFGIAVGLVDLVDYHDRLETKLQRLLQYEPGLRHRSFEGVNDEQHPLGHVQDPLHLTPEIGVAGSVYDVDLDIPVTYRDILRQDRYASFTFEGIAVENQLTHVLVVAEKLNLV